MVEANEERLSGGNVGDVFRVGKTVRRSTGQWTPAVHRLLDAYAAAGIGETPRALGCDEHQREILSFLPGTMMSSLEPDALWADSLLHDAASLMRRMHDASTPLIDDALVWRQPTHPPAEVICHNDFAPYNLVTQSGRVTGIIDLDMASPGSRLWDLAYLAYRVVPFAEDAPDYEPRRHGSLKTRLSLLTDAYGQSYSWDEMYAMAATRLDALAAFTDAQASLTGRGDLRLHAAMYRRDAARLRAT